MVCPWPPSQALLAILIPRPVQRVFVAYSGESSCYLKPQRTRKCSPATVVHQRSRRWNGFWSDYGTSLCGRVRPSPLGPRERGYHARGDEGGVSYWPVRYRNRVAGPIYVEARSGVARACCPHHGDWMVRCCWCVHSPFSVNGFLHISPGFTALLFPSLSFISCLAISACLTPTDPVISAAIVGKCFRASLGSPKVG